MKHNEILIDEDVIYLYIFCYVHPSVGALFFSTIKYILYFCFCSHNHKAIEWLESLM